MMTSREFFKSVITLAGEQPENAGLVEFATKEIASLDAKNAKAQEKRKEKELANAPICNGMLEYLSNHKSGALASELACHCNVSTSKITALGTKLENQGKITKTEKSIPKVGKRMVYKLVVKEEISNETETE